MSTQFSKTRYFTSSHYHFMEIREARNGNPYVVLTQSTKRDGAFDQKTWVLFEDEIDGLIEKLSALRQKLASGTYRDSP